MSSYLIVFTSKWCCFGCFFLVPEHPHKSHSRTRLILDQDQRSQVCLKTFGWSLSWLINTNLLERSNWCLKDCLSFVIAPIWGNVFFIAIATALLLKPLVILTSPIILYEYQFQESSKHTMPLHVGPTTEWWPQSSQIDCQLNLKSKKVTTHPWSTPQATPLPNYERIPFTVCW